MRHNTPLALAVVATLSLFIANSAGAISLTLNIDGVFTSGSAPSATAVVTSSSVQNLEIGDIVQFSIDVANPTAEYILAIFSTLTFDPTKFSLVGGALPPTILLVPAMTVPPFTPAELLFARVAGPVIKIASLPLGDQIQALAFDHAAGSTGTGPEIGAATIRLEVTGNGASDVDLGFFFANDHLVIDGLDFAGEQAAALVPVNNATISLATVAAVPSSSAWVLGVLVLLLAAALWVARNAAQAKKRRA